MAVLEAVLEQHGSQGSELPCSSVEGATATGLMITARGKQRSNENDLCIKLLGGNFTNYFSLKELIFGLSLLTLNIFLLKISLVKYTDYSNSSLCICDFHIMFLRLQNA